MFIKLSGGFNEDSNLYLNKLKEDGFLKVHEDLTRNPATNQEYLQHSASITPSGIEFYEQGGYRNQFEQNRSQQEQASDYKRRELYAAETSAKASQDSAKSSRSSAYAAWAALVVTLIISLIQYKCAKDTDSKTKVTLTKLDSLTIELKKAKSSIELTKDSLTHFKRPPKHSLKSSNANNKT